ncbi:hypothetical protein HDV03_000119 [Kappamyces sp. JEL0829]|nr:hypothetical protein HDV03_000119 [Kappamyces sp. JEL0829]
MLQHRFALVVAPLARKSFDFFQVAVESPAWKSELVPATDKRLELKTCLLTRSRRLRFHLYGAKSSYGVVGEPVLLSSLCYSDGESFCQFELDGRLVAVLDITTEVVDPALFVDVDEETIACFDVGTVHGSDVSITLVESHEFSIQSTYLQLLQASAEYFQKELDAQLAKPAVLVNHLSQHLHHRVELLCQKRVDKLKEWKRLGLGETVRSAGSLMVADRHITEWTIKELCQPPSVGRLDGHIPTVEELMASFSAFSVHHLEHHVNNSLSVLKKDLEGFHVIAKSFLLHDASMVKVKQLFQRTKDTLDKTLVVLGKIRSAARRNYGDKSPNTAVLESAIIELSNLAQKNFLHIPEGPVVKNVRFVYDRILTAIHICKHILESFEPVQIVSPTMEPAFLLVVSRVVSLFQRFLKAWGTAEHTHVLSTDIGPFLKRFGFLFRLYVPQDAVPESRQLQMLSTTLLSVHSARDQPGIAVSIENACLLLSVPIEPGYLDFGMKIRVRPVVVPYSTTPSTTPAQKIRNINHATIELFKEFEKTLPYSDRPPWAPMDASCWLPVPQLTTMTRWIESYVSHSSKALFGCCWLHPCPKGDFTDNEMDVLEHEAHVNIVA